MGGDGIGEFIRVRVKTDITKPLLRGKKINLGKRESVWVRFSYERFPNLSYCCGRLAIAIKIVFSRKSKQIRKWVYVQSVDESYSFKWSGRFLS